MGFSMFFFGVCALFQIAFVRSQHNGFVHEPSYLEGMTKVRNPFATGRQMSQNQISFVTDDWAGLYVNGVPVSESFVANELVTVNLSALADGDVIAFIAGDYGLRNGISVDAMVNGKRIVTGSNGWRARKAFAIPSTPMVWTTPHFSAVSWPIAKLTANELPFLNGSQARTVWAADADQVSTIFLRYAIGGEPKAIPFSFAAYGMAWVYVNGQLVASNNDGTVATQVTLYLRKGDVIAVRAGSVTGKVGFIAAVKKSVTGRSPWRSAVANAALDGPNGWMSKSFNACRWAKPFALPKQQLPKNYPKSNAARYLWVKGGENVTYVYFRLRFGKFC